MDKIALVTGAGTGIGKAVAHGLLTAGYTTVFTGRRKEVLDDAVNEAPSGGGAATAFACDVANENAVDALFDSIEQNHGRLDVLFNNAGLGLTSATIDEIDPAEWRKIIGVNLTGSFLCARRAFALMRKQDPMGGRIINNGSIHGFQTRHNRAHQNNLARRPSIQHRLQPDRHRQRRNRNDRLYCQSRHAGRWHNHVRTRDGRRSRR